MTTLERYSLMVLALLVLACPAPSSQTGETPWLALELQQAAPQEKTQPAAPQRKPDVHFVPTPYEVVEEMLKMANVKKDDVVYDLGCGDGRIVILAAKKFGARGVGIDVDPERIRESQENARKEGVTDRVQFRQEDLFEANLREATVVTLYLLQRLNEKLKPKLFRELRPGTRVVSHRFDMGDWKPDKVVEVGSNTIYYWVIPATPPSNNSVIAPPKSTVRWNQPAPPKPPSEAAPRP